MIIPYSPLPGFKNNTVFSPLIPVTLQNGKYEFSTFALVDSGANGAVISTDIAETLNISWRKIPNAHGISLAGTFRSYQFDGLRANIYGHEFVLSAGVVKSVSPYKCILGQNDLFHMQRSRLNGTKVNSKLFFVNSIKWRFLELNIDENPRI